MTPADYLVRGLQLAPLDTPPEVVPEGAHCVITGQPIGQGYPVANMVTGATNEFLDCFRGGVGGWVSEAAAICFKNADPRKGNPTARACMVFEDGTYYNPLISRESAATQDGREAWSDRVREVWPERQGQRALIILTTDMKRRLWPKARIGALGSRTPVLCYDAQSAGAEVQLIDWARMLACLDLVEEVYTARFTKGAIRECLWHNWNVAQALGIWPTREYERGLAGWRGSAEFWMAALIAQRGTDE